MATDPESFMDAAQDFLAKMEASKLIAQDELEAVRKELVRDVKREARKTARSLQTAKIGAAKILIPNADNLRKINLSSERTRTRLSSFRLSYLDRSQVTRLTEDGTMSQDPKKFIRHSRRLARHAREFLVQIKETEPSLEEEVDATLLQLEDNDLDLLKLEVKSMTRMKETLLRGVQGRKERGQVLKEIDDWDINRQLFNLSLLEHPDAVVRDLFASATEAMGSATTTKVSEIAKRAHVFVGLPPTAAANMTKNSRVADLSWRLFSTADVDKKFKALPGKQASPGGRRGLGLGFNTKEWYIPVPPSMVEGLTPLAVAARSRAFAAAEAAAASRLAAQSAAAREELAAIEARQRAAEEAAEKRLETERKALEKFERDSAITRPQ